MTKNPLKEYSKGLKIKGAIAPFFKLLEALLELMIPLIIADLIDNGIANNDKNYIFIRFFFLIGFGVLGFLFALCAQYFSAKVATTYSSRLRVGLYEHIESLSYKELDKIGSSTLLTRLTNDVNLIQNGINMFLRLFLRSPFIVLGALVMAFIVDPLMAIIFVVAIPLLALIVVLIMKYTIPKYKKVNAGLDHITKVSKENLSGVRVIRAFTSENKEQEEFNAKNDDYLRLQKGVSYISILMNPLTILIVNIAIVLILYYGGLRVNVGTLTSGQVVALYNYTNYILVELIKFANLILTITKALASNKRIEELFEVESSLTFTSGDKVNDYQLSFDQVSFKYSKKGKEALKDISFTLNKNESLGIIGGTGSGKSTLINLIGHNYNLNEGNIYVDGKNITSYNLKELRSKIGVVSQKATLFKGTIKSNLTLNQDIPLEDIDEALRISQASSIVSKKKLGLDEEVEQAGRNFSGGEKQRLTIARALLKKPEILILDDSSSALDYQTDLKLRNELKNIKNMSLIIVSQRTSSLLNCDKIIVLDHGEMVDIGTHEELLERCSLYQEIHYSQFEKKEVSTHE